MKSMWQHLVARLYSTFISINLSQSVYLSLPLVFPYSNPQHRPPPPPLHIVIISSPLICSSFHTRSIPLSYSTISFSDLILFLLSSVPLLFSFLLTAVFWQDVNLGAGGNQRRSLRKNKEKGMRGNGREHETRQYRDDGCWWMMMTMDDGDGDGWCGC